jgi:signal transduction histidine kinase
LAVDLETVLSAFVRRIPCRAADLAIRWGDRFRVACVRGLEDTWLGHESALAESSVETRLVRYRRPVLVRDGAPERGCPLPASSGLQSWLGVPLVIGSRVIGRVGLASPEAGRFDRRDSDAGMRLAKEHAPVVESVLLFQEATRRLGRLAVVNEIASLSAGLKDPDRITERCVSVLRRAFNTDWAYFIATGPREDEFALHPAAGREPPAVNGEAIQLLLRRCRPAETLRRTRSREEGQGWLNENARSQLARPVRYGGACLGVLVIEHERPKALSEEDERLLAIIGGQMAGLLENAQLYGEMEVAVRQLTAVRETALDLASQLDFPGVLDNLVERTQFLMGVPTAELGLVDAERGGLRIAVSRSPWGDFRDTWIPLGEGLEGQVALDGRPAAGPARLWWKARAPRRRRTQGMAACVPLRWGEETIGVLSVVDDSPGRAFTSEDMRLLGLLAPQAAITLRNAHLVRNLREQMDERKQTEARLIQSAKLAAVGQMAAGLAHEINNPLTTVAGFAELWLDEMAADDPRRQEMELMTREAQRARAVVMRLLDFARQGERVRERSELNEVVREGLDLIRHLLRLHGIELQVRFAEGLPWMDLDRGGIKQVLLNLIHNAIQAMPAGGQLWVETEHAMHSDRAGVVVRVRDTGMGIAPENLGRIFEPFFTTKPGGEGTGLGLAVSYGIVSEAGGVISVESVVGQGSVFEVWLPLSKEVEG